MKKCFLFAAIFGLVLVSLGYGAVPDANLVSYNFAGTINNNWGWNFPNGTPPIGTQYSGTVVYDISAQGIPYPNSSSQYIYNNALVSIELTVGDFKLSGKGGRIVVYNDTGNGIIEFSAWAVQGAALSGNIEGYFLNALDLSLRNTSGPMPDGFSLPKDLSFFHSTLSQSWADYDVISVDGYQNSRLVGSGPLSLLQPAKPGKIDDPDVALVKVAVDLAAGSGIDAGHAWIEVSYLPFSSEERETWGTWRTTITGGSLFPNREIDRTSVASRSLFVTKEQYDKLMNVVDKYKKKGGRAWSFLNNCTAFAKDAWKSVSGEKIDTYFIEDLGFPRPILPNPISAMYSIIDLNGGFSDRTINQCDSPYCASPCPPPAIFCN